MTDAPPSNAADGAALARGWLENSPFVEHLGIQLESMEPGSARLRLPYSEHLPTTARSFTAARSAR